MKEQPLFLGGINRLIHFFQGNNTSAFLTADTDHIASCREGFHLPGRLDRIPGELLGLDNLAHHIDQVQLQRLAPIKCQIQICDTLCRIRKERSSC